MKKTLLLTALLLCAATFSGCTSTSQRIRNENDRLTSIAVYATDDSIKVKRYDLAKEYSSTSTQLVAPPLPKDRIKIQGFTKKVTKPKVDADKDSKVKTPDPIVIEMPVVVLPSEDAGAPVVIVDSTEYKAMEEKYKKQLADEKLAKGKLQEEVDQLKRDKETAINNQIEKDKNSGFFNSIKHLFGWTSLIGLLIGGGAIALFILNPPLFAAVFGVVTKIWQIVAIIFTKIFQAVRWVLDKIINRSKSG